MIFEKILGNESDELFSEKIHHLSHKSLVDYIEIKPEDSFRRRMRMVSVNGREYKLAIPRSQKIENGSILWLSEESAVVIRILNGPKIRVIPKNISSAVRLGYHCGNLHWKTNFFQDGIDIILSGESQNYFDRLETLEEFADFEVEYLENDN
jgi:urease accessory protein